MSEGGLQGEILPPLGDEAEIEALLIEYDGSVRKVAKKLGVPSGKLRKAVAMSPRLTGAIDEVFESVVDEAVEVLFEGLRREDSYQTQFYAAKEFLRTGTARKRGFGHEASGQATLELKDKGGSRTITLRWLEAPEGPEGRSVLGGIGSSAPEELTEEPNGPESD